MITLRPADEKDMERIEELAYSAPGVDHSPLGSLLDRPRLLESVQTMIGKRLVIAAEVDGVMAGGAVGLLCPSDFTKDTLFHVGLIYLAPEYREYSRAFLKQIEWLVKDKATRITLSVPYGWEHEKRQRFYQMLGYRPLETYMVKAL